MNVSCIIFSIILACLLCPDLYYICIFITFKSILILHAYCVKLLFIVICYICLSDCIIYYISYLISVIYCFNLEFNFLKSMYSVELESSCRSCLGQA